MKQYRSLDLAKLVCALLVVVLHTAPFSSYSRVLTFGFRNIVTVIAVPFFFTTSGFLTFKKIEETAENERRKYMTDYIKRLAVMYLIWSAVYFVFVVIKWTRGDFSVFSVLEYIRDFFFEGSYATIWFLPALLSATIIVFYLHNKFSYAKIFAFSCFIYIFTLCGSSYYGLVIKVPIMKLLLDVYYFFFDTIKNGVCFGMIFVSMGALLAEKEAELTKGASPIKMFALTGGFALLLAAEEFLVAFFDWNIRGVDTVICLIPFTYFFFRFVILLDLPLSDNVCRAMRKYSILMFLSQRIPLSVISLYLADSIFATNSLVHFVAVLGTTLFISNLIIKAAERFEIMRWVY